MDLYKIVAIIPAYKPSNVLYDIIKKIVLQFKYILIIDDGSGYEYDSLFNSCLEINSNVLLYKNIINMGKGRAIKNGINYIFNILNDEINAKNIIGFVTLDADGQHTVNDIVKCSKKFMEDTTKLVLGVRNFDKNVPLRSKFGNTITSLIMRLLYGIKLKDTQTGLRVFSIDNAKKFLALNGERYEYEILMLIETSRKKIQIAEQEIETIYIDNNENSHFNPIIDSLKIYKIILLEFMKFSISSILSFIIDISLFSLFVSLFKYHFYYYVIISSVIARVISSFINYNLNKNLVFKNRKKITDTIQNYYMLAIVILIVSSLSTHFLSLAFNGKEVILKICIDFLIFFVDYRIQKVIFGE